MKTMSISINEVLYDKLKHSVPANKISKFVNNAISKELEQKEQELILAYQTVELDNDRKKILDEWDAIDDNIKE